MKLPVRTLDNDDAGEIELDDGVFGVPAARPDPKTREPKDQRTALLHRVVTWQLARRRAGTHKTRTVSEISGTTKKPFKQKGTGRARQGSNRSVQFRGGAVAHGPVPRDHGFDLPKKVRKLALRHALSSKVEEGRLIVLDRLATEDHKTRAMAARLKALGIESALIVDGDEVDGTFRLAVGNLPRIDVLPQLGANVYDILRHDTLVLSRDAAHALEARLR